MSINLNQYDKIIVFQRRELAELFGFETRNKYQICNEKKEIIGFCAEQNKGLFGFLMRQILGHWRSFEVHFFDENRIEFMRSIHPFRFFFQEFSVLDSDNRTIGHIRQRFGIFTKKFDVLDEKGQLILRMRSGFFKFWTFPFEGLNGNERAVVRKKWSGLLAEIFLDADNFLVEYIDTKLSEDERKIILAASVFTDLQYFEKKAD